MSEILRRFNGDVHTKEAIVEYLTNHLKEKIIERALLKQNTDSLADAIIELEKGFEQLAIDYGIKQQSKPITQDAR